MPYSNVTTPFPSTTTDRCNGPVTVYAPNANPLVWDTGHFYYPSSETCYYACSGTATTTGCTDGEQLATWVANPPFTVTDGGKLPGVTQTVNIPWDGLIPTETSIDTYINTDTTISITYTNGAQPSYPTTFSIAEPRTTGGVISEYIA